MGMPEQAWLDDLYRQYRRALFLTAWNILRCPSLAEDAVHSAFASLAKLRKPPREPKLYAFRTVRNAAIDFARIRARRREEPILADMERMSFELLTTDDEPLAAVSAALGNLDPVAREVVELHLHAGLTFQEIAALLEEPLPTVASRYRRTIERLRQMLEICHE
ncbi:MAG TPA: sigma-70 family RNA polymerase sigma factor [Planctomycetaceae bacterium]|jgi:RNA polymerase sigma-70 factor (ECF subfamily)|nr:sigma-70 family RNA polymerase sigma factor [Planctomycetaceae bacterium]